MVHFNFLWKLQQLGLQQVALCSYRTKRKRRSKRRGCWVVLVSGSAAERVLGEWVTTKSRHRPKTAVCLFYLHPAGWMSTVPGRTKSTQEKGNRILSTQGTSLWWNIHPIRRSRPPNCRQHGRVCVQVCGEHRRERRARLPSHMKYHTTRDELIPA